MDAEVGGTSAEEDYEPEGWYKVKKGGKAVPMQREERQPEVSGAATQERPNHFKRAAGKKLAEKSVGKQHVRIPDGATRITLRPQGGLALLTRLGATRLLYYVCKETGISYGDARRDILSPNEAQQTLLIATEDMKRAEKYQQITSITTEEGSKTEIKAHMTIPESRGKGVIHNVHLSVSDAELVAELEFNASLGINPKVIAVRRQPPVDYDPPRLPRGAGPKDYKALRLLREMLPVQETLRSLLSMRGPGTPDGRVP
ncbi:hypothetical protein V5799_033085 [Amblyomma americanum]|uniref:Uncharacterized protein n=1 Tax=Amblyomma americanum TaxID=6943 RepID=A0AAQ4DPC0_AMBAM